MQAQPKTLKKPGKTIGQQILNLNKVSNKPQPHHCGYCDKYKSCSWGFTKDVMHPYTYQLLAEKGWRRCGTYFYKPDIKQSCCKLWTHRMDTNKFKIKKDQRKTVKHVMEWLSQKMGKTINQSLDKKNSNQKPKEEIQSEQKNNLQKKPKIQQKQKMTLQIPQKWNNFTMQTAKRLLNKIQQNSNLFYSLFSKNFISPQKINQFNIKIDLSKVKCFLSDAKADSDFYSNLLMILFGINKKIFKKQYSNVDFIKDINEFIEKYLNQDNKFAKIEVQRSGYLLFTEYQGLKMERRIKIQKQIQQNKLNHLKKQTEQKQKPKLNEKQKVRQHSQNKKNNNNNGNTEKMESEQIRFSLQISSHQIYFGPLSIIVVPAQVTTQSWKMYQRYCQQIHEKPQKSQSSYSGFLCEKSLKFVQQQNTQQSTAQYTPSWQIQNPNKYSSKIKGKRSKLMGCYHMKYYIQKELIGIGVVDLLPDGLSSVYFFYQPKYKDLRLGVFSSLIQIQYVRWLSLSFPQYKYYYMGFYIQNCVKMSYKGNYQPFELLCPITYQFVQCTPELRQLVDKIQKRQIQQIQLSKNNNKIPDMVFQDIGVYISQKIKIKYEGKNLSLKDLNPKIVIPVLGMLRDMVQVWGKQIFEIFTFTF